MADQPWFEVRPSPIHGQGVFALRPIPRGTRVAEYVGERITPAEADARYDDDAHEHPTTYLFVLDDNTMIDGLVGGNESRFINHSCDPNCETSIEDGRIWVEAIANIPEGAELTFDYRIVRAGRRDPSWDALYACRCGAPTCRGTMLKSARRRRRAG